MTYRLNRQLFVENGPAEQAADDAAARPAVRFLPWRKLDFGHRLEIVEQALKTPANDIVHGYPVAL